LKQVRIIHGKGTGTLRANIGDFLAKHPHVSRIRPGNWDEGNIGVTIVELKD